ncbi:MAG: GFA family protein [Pseudomonadota bacterium]
MQSTGQCLCGAVRITAVAADSFQACHCTECQRWTGGGPLYAIRVTDLRIDGEDAVRAYRHSAWGERVFCGTCGTALYWKLQGRSIAFVALGLLDDRSGKRLGEEIFVDHRPDWLPSAEGAAQHYEAEMKAQLDAFLKTETSL